MQRDLTRAERARRGLGAKNRCYLPDGEREHCLAHPYAFGGCDAGDSAGIRGDIAGLADGYNSLLGERDIPVVNVPGWFSPGLGADVPFLLLDDCLAAVDGDRAAGNSCRFATSVGQRGALVVAHRLATVAQCDHIYVLEQGRISEREIIGHTQLGGHCQV